MILSYILHGHLPIYSPEPAHVDHLLHVKLEAAPHLLDADVPALTEHFAASRLSYSTQALPVNVLLDTLVRPNIDVVEDGESVTNLQWRDEPTKAVPHLVLGDASQPGGQWTNDPLQDNQTLSYAPMMSLPGYSYAQHYRRRTGRDLPAFNRPARRDLTDYLCSYPKEVNIEPVFRSGANVSGISRTENGFYIRSHNVLCRHLVLATGVFSEVIPPPPLLRPLLLAPPQLQPTPEAPLLVVGSGFSAADAIIASPATQRIIHVFKWDPEFRPSPLHGCHPQAYPEYAGVYRLMKRTALFSEGWSRRATFRSKGNASLTGFLEARCWDQIYEGLANVEIVGVDMQQPGHEATVTFRREADGTVFSRQVRGLVYAVGRRGNLDYLDRSLLREVIAGGEEEGGTPGGASVDTLGPMIVGQTLRNKAYDDLEVARNVFIIGSLTGDSLIRFAYGGCVYTAGKLIRAYTHSHNMHETDDTDKPIKGSGNTNGQLELSTSSTKRPLTLAMNGMEGHDHNYNVISSVSDKRGLPSWLWSPVSFWR